MKQRSVFLASVSILSCIISTGSVEALPCLFPKLYPELKWKSFTPGVRLGPYHAVLTCEGATVTIRSNAKFFIRNTWEEESLGYVGQIPPQTLIRIQPGRSEQPEIEAELVAAQREVYYSQDVETMKKLKVVSFWSKTEEEITRVLRRLEEAWEEVKEMEWEPLKLDRKLDPWDMLWIRKSSRVEIEILEKGPLYHTYADRTVRDSHGQFTDKLRFPQKSVWMMEPNSYGRAKVNKIIGEVWIATDHKRVEGFLEKYGWSSMGGSYMTDEAYREWQEMLNRKELE